MSPTDLVLADVVRQIERRRENVDADLARPLRKLGRMRLWRLRNGNPVMLRTIVCIADQLGCDVKIVLRPRDPAPPSATARIISPSMEG